jgi:hypothetical protein
MEEFKLKINLNENEVLLALFTVDLLGEVPVTHMMMMMMMMKTTKRGIPSNSMFTAGVAVAECCELEGWIS